MSVLGTKREIAAYFNRDKLARERMWSLTSSYVAKGKDVTNYPKQGLTYGTNIRAIMETVPAKELADVIKDAIQERRFIGKWIRPWDIVPPEKRLDKDKVWVGWEMETGFNSPNHFYNALKWFDNRVKGGCYDQEGSGSYCCEFTFYPTHLEDIQHKGGPNRLIKRLTKGDITPAVHDPDEHIGTHANISTPKSRSTPPHMRDSEEYRDYGYARDGDEDDNGCTCEECTADRQRRVAVATARVEARRNGTLVQYPGHQFEYEFERAVEGMAPADRDLLFGRAYPYDTICVYHGKQFEFKLFNSTYSIDQWNRYCVVVKHIADIIQWMEAQTDTSQIISATIRAKLLEIKPTIEAMPKGTEPEYNPDSDDYEDRREMSFLAADDDDYDSDYY